MKDKTQYIYKLVSYYACLKNYTIIGYFPMRFKR